MVMVSHPAQSAILQDEAPSPPLIEAQNSGHLVAFGRPCGLFRSPTVIGEPHLELDETPVAYVVRRDGSTVSPEEIMEFAASGVAKYKRLSKVIFTDAIPRSPSGKILRRVIKEKHVADGF